MHTIRQRDIDRDSSLSAGLNHSRRAARYLRIITLVSVCSTLQCYFLVSTRIHVNWLAWACNSPRFNWNYNYCKQKRFSDKLTFATDPNIPTFTVSFCVCVIFRLGLGFMSPWAVEWEDTMTLFSIFLAPSLLKIIIFQSRLREESRRRGTQGVCQNWVCVK